MRRKVKRKGSAFWQILIVRKPLFIGRGQAIHKYGCKLWIVREHPCPTEDSKVKVYLFKQNRKPIVDKFFRKAMGFILRLFGSATVTYLFALWIIEQAFLERGYTACGGELLFVPVIFYLMCKLFKL